MIFYCFPFVHLTLFLNNLLPTYFTTSKIFYIQLFNYLCCTLLVLFGFKYNCRMLKVDPRVWLAMWNFSSFSRFKMCWFEWQQQKCVGLSFVIISFRDIIFPKFLQLLLLLFFFFEKHLQLCIWVVKVRLILAFWTQNWCHVFLY